MLWIQWITLSIFGWVLVYFIGLLIRLVRIGAPIDHATAAGSTREGILYAYTNAMLPTHKSSAYHHLPSFSLGVLFHIGTFLSFALLILSFFPFLPQSLSSSTVLSYLLFFILFFTSVSGIILFVKRIINPNLRALSCADDFISNGLTTLFQIGACLYCMAPLHVHTVYFYNIIASLLMLYMPVGKLKHVIYFFAARYQIGFFYGRRGVWYIKKKLRTHDK
jgi:hypothetical protein